MPYHYVCTSIFIGNRTENVFKKSRCGNTSGYVRPFTWYHWKLLALRAKLKKDTRLQATGTYDRPAYEDPCNITWCMTLQVFRGSISSIISGFGVPIFSVAASEEAGYKRFPFPVLYISDT